LEFLSDKEVSVKQQKIDFGGILSKYFLENVQI
jgi:hypothetical protein